MNQNRHTIYACGIIAILAFALYANTIMHEYVLDDLVVITDNSYTKQGIAGIWKILSSDTFEGHFGRQNMAIGGRYRPLSLVTFAIEYEFLGLNPYFSHFINIILYALTGVLIYLILKRVLPNPLPLWGCRRSKNTPSPLVGEGRGEGKIQATPIFPLPLTPSHKGREDSENILPYKTRWYFSIPFLTAILFIAHPIHTEVVANIKERDDIMALIGSLLTLIFTLKYLDLRKARYLTYSFATFFLALLSKENAITFVFIIPVTIYFFTSHSVKKNSGALAPLILASILFLVIRQFFIGGPKTEFIQELMLNPFLDSTTAERYATIFYTFGLYIKLLFFPHPLTADYYPHHIPIIGLTDPRAIIPLVIYALLILYVLTRARKKSVITYGISFYLITFSIVSNIFFSIGVFMAERYIYMPSLGFCIIIAYLFSQKLPQLLKNNTLTSMTLIPAFVIILSLYSIKTIDRNGAWKNSVTLYTTDVKTSSESIFSNTWAGIALHKEAIKEKNPAKKDEYLEASIKYLKKAIDLYPKNALALMNLGDVYRDYKNSYNEAEDYYNKALQINPTSYEVYNSLGMLYGQYLNDADKAVSYLEKALELKPDSYETLSNLGIAYGIKKDYVKSATLLERALSLAPDRPEIYYNLGVAHKQLGNNSKAQEYFNKATALGYH